jgi:hypothetical protein
VEGQARLGRVERIGQLTHTTFSQPKTLENGKPCLIGEGMKQTGATAGLGASAGYHTSEDINYS